MNSWQFRCITRLVNERPPTTKTCLSVLFELLDERDEIAVAADDHIGVDVTVGERHLEGVEREVDVGAVLVAAGCEVALDQLRRVLRQRSTVVTRARPIAVRDLRDDFPALLQGFQHHADVELGTERALDADLDVVEVDENRNLQSCICQNLPACPSPPAWRRDVRLRATLRRTAVASAAGHPAIAPLWPQKQARLGQNRVRPRRARQVYWARTSYA